MKKFFTILFFVCYFAAATAGFCFAYEALHSAVTVDLPHTTAGQIKEAEEALLTLLFVVFYMPGFILLYRTPAGDGTEKSK